MPLNIMLNSSSEKLIFIQSRAEINFSVVAEYAEMMRDGIEFDPVSAIQDGEQIYVWDGYHRAEAAKEAGMKLAVNVQPGTRQDAEWLALSANQKHGLRRTKADEEQIARNALLKFPDRSIREIHRHTGINRRKISRLQDELIASGAIAPDNKVTVTRGGVTYQQDTSNIGSQVNSATLPVGTTSGIPREPARADNCITEPNRADYWADGNPTEYKPKAQEFECPRCGQEKIVGVNGSERWCLNCGAEWPTAVDFLEEAKATGNQMTRPLTQEHVQSRFLDILARLEGQEEQLAQVNIWLDELERKLCSPQIDDAPELVTWPIPIQILENA